LNLIAHEVPATVERRAVRELLQAASNDDAPTPEELAALKMPILLLWGKSERLFPNRHFEYFTENLPKHAILERPESFGHCPHLDAPKRLAERIVTFARTV
jgi:pimeloyl-ACP methyl ester carboxylesterase